jgi:hypothetical protein
VTINRRELLRKAGAVLAVPQLALRGAERAARPENGATRADHPAGAHTPHGGGQPHSERAAWVALAGKLADPVLTNLASGLLHARMPVEQAPNTDRRNVTHLEGVGRLLAGIAPWLELPEDTSEEGRLRSRYAALVHEGLARAVDPGSADFMNFTRERQPLVDAAFLAQGLLRAPRALLGAIAASTRQNLIAALESTRVIPPAFSNWLLFTAMVEAGLAALGARWDGTRVEYAVRQHEQWYRGDGAYSDGPAFHWDYYNSFVIHPMLVDVLEACKGESPAWTEISVRVEQRARRYAAVQERLIAPDGSFPPIGRSIAYRCGAFHLLAQSALRRRLPDGVSPAQVRGALGAVIHRTLDAPDTFDKDGWLQIGFCGHQPGIGETYISTGSLYLCSVALLPLGLPPGDEFWSAPGEPWTSARAWNRQPFPIDHAL